MTAEKTGRCLCGAVKFTAVPKARHIDACHCGMCRRAVGGPLMAVTLAAAPLIEDESALRVYQSSDWAERLFCGTCGSNLFYRLRDGRMHSVNAGALDDLGEFEFTTEIFIDEKPGFYSFAGETRKLTGAEVYALFADDQDTDHG